MSHIIKFFEKVVAKKLWYTLKRRTYLTKHQHGFRKGRSCLSQLLEHYQVILQYMETNSDVHVVYLDFCKAFDKVDHKVLLQKLVAIGISGKLLKWIGGFLIGRTHAVVVDGAKSEAASVNSGVPQGSVLGPLLFLVLISDIDANLNSASASSFADDTRVIMPIKCDGDRLQMQQDLSNVYKWAEDNAMVFNDAKFECLMYMCHANSSLPPDYLNNAGQSIEVSEEVKDLGILMSGNGSYRAHLGEIVTKARRQVGWILRTFSCRDRVSTEH